MNNDAEMSPIVGKCCKTATYGVSKVDPTKDLLVLKVTNIHADNTRTHGLMCIENYVRDVYVVKEKYRKFKQKKDYISIKMCDRYQSTQAKLANALTRILYGHPDKKADLKQVLNSPYVFGCEQSTPVIMKQKFFEKYGKYQEEESYRTAAYDVETNMFSVKEEVVMASTTFCDKAYFAAVRGWFDEKTDEEILRNLKEHELELLTETLQRRGCTVQYELFDNEAQVVAANIQKWHEWKPDWIASWNARFDMEKNEAALRRFGYNVEDVYNDPGIPKEYRFYELDKGRTHKRKENGDLTALEDQERFPTIRNFASWKWLDAMSFYAIKRTPQGKKDKYTLQFTAEDNNDKKHPIEGKLYTKHGSHLPPGSPDWHRYMQKHHKYVYCMYNLKDNFVIEDLNDKTGDLSLSLPMLLKSSEFFNYPSQPKIISDELSIIAKQHGYVWGTTGTVKTDEFDKYKPALSKWIALLETEKNAELGKALFVGMPGIKSRGRGSTSDTDVSGAYPSGTVAGNVSNKTTRIETCRIEGLDDLEFRRVGINYASSPEANAIYLASILHRFPNLNEIDSVWAKILETEAANTASDCNERVAA